jgi:hypothetical protein
MGLISCWPWCSVIADNGDGTMEFLHYYSGRQILATEVNITTNRGSTVQL